MAIINKKKYIGFVGTLKTIYKEEGLKGYYKGILCFLLLMYFWDLGYSATIISVPLFHSMFFALYN